MILVGGGPGNLDLLTVGGLAAIRRADVIVTDRLAPLAALDHARPDAIVIDVAKIPRGASTSQEQINAVLRRARRPPAVRSCGSRAATASCSAAVARSGRPVRRPAFR